MSKIVLLDDDNCFDEKEKYSTDKGLVYVYYKVKNADQSASIRRLRQAIGMVLLEENKEEERWLCPM